MGHKKVDVKFCCVSFLNAYGMFFVFSKPKNLITILPAFFNRLGIGDQLMLFRWPGLEESVQGYPMSGDDAVSEFQVC